MSTTTPTYPRRAHFFKSRFSNSVMIFNTLLGKLVAKNRLTLPNRTSIGSFKIHITRTLLHQFQKFNMFQNLQIGIYTKKCFHGVTN